MNTNNSAHRDSSLSKPVFVEPLTDRELEILALLGDRHTDREITAACYR